MVGLCVAEVGPFRWKTNQPQQSARSFFLLLLSPTCFFYLSSAARLFLNRLDRQYNARFGIVPLFEHTHKRSIFCRDPFRKDNDLSSYIAFSHFIFVFVSPAQRHHLGLFEHLGEKW